MMTNKGQILIIDSTGNRLEDLCNLWAAVLGYDVLFSGGSEFLRFQENGEARSLTVEELSTVQPVACLFHLGDKRRYTNTETKHLVDSSRRVVLFSGAGITAKGDWSDKWFWIPRAIPAKSSVREGEWKELADWLSAKSSVPADGGRLDFLSAGKQANFLIALYILCQGFLAGERMRERVPAAVSQTRNREWWSVPLLQSAGENLVEVVTQEWGGAISPSVLQLVEWIAAKPTTSTLDVGQIVADAKADIENKIAK